MIRYHGTPFSGGVKSQAALKNKHAMVSFVNQECSAMIMDTVQSFCMDSGAYSVWESGGELDLLGYAEWVSTYYRHPSCTFYCIPDSIKGDTAANVQMRADWFSMVDRDVWRKGWPVWHLHESLDVLQEMMIAFPGICLGSSGQYSKVESKIWWGRMAEAFDVLTDEQGRPKIPVHGLRMLSPTVYSVLPLTSGDSCNTALHCGPERFPGPYKKLSNYQRAVIMMWINEEHEAATWWNRDAQNGIKNMELFG